jgi:hypothetical protein
MAKRAEVIENKEQEVEEVQEKPDRRLGKVWSWRGASMGKGSREKIVCQYSY